MARLNIMSDLHLEFGPMPPLPGGDVLILAGDVGLATEPETYIPFLEENSRKYEYIVAVMGNHEHYLGDITKTERRLGTRTADIENFFLLENESVDFIGEGIIGSTLWSNIEEQNELEIQRSMNDYNIVQNCTPAVTRAKYLHSIDYIRGALLDYPKAVVVTHHSPTTRAPEAYRGNALNSAYGSEVPWLKEEGPALWIHGHTHVSEDYVEGRTRVLCNPRGYYGREENPNFNINLVVDV